MENNNQAFKAISRICLNNWHYIDQKVLNLHKNINFFTGHSGSGKSTVIDALQIVLYANTDGRSFFNKAAADDSDRSLIEYLRGMINIGENGQAQYKRNQNFSTTIVLELEQTITHEKECVGIVFDVDVTANEYSRLFFWHKGPVPESCYRNGSRVVSIGELKADFQEKADRDSYFYTSSNERFRRNLYDVYLGGLDMEKFPRLFKRAIPFKMNIRLEDFVKEYICMEQDIHIEEMQESVILYGRMRRKIEEAMEEIGELEEIARQYARYQETGVSQIRYTYRHERLAICQLEQSLLELQAKVEAGSRKFLDQKEGLEKLELLRVEAQAQYDEINRQIVGSGYAQLEAKWKDLQENIELLERSGRKWEDMAARLEQWKEEDAASNQILWDIDKLQKGTITGEELTRLKNSLKDIYEETDKLRQDASGEGRRVKKECAQLEQDLMEIHLGKKTYPKELEDARREIRRGLYDKLGKDIPVRVLADLLDIRDEKWRNAIEGYLGSNKLALVVEPKYIREALEIYEGLQDKRFWRVSLVDTQKLSGQENTVRPGSLAEEVETSEGYVKALVDFLLGSVMKCDTVKELRDCRIGVTSDCLLYQNYQLRRLNPDNYTRKAFIGEKSMRRRQKELQTQLEELKNKGEALEKEAGEAVRILGLEYLTAPVEEYLEQLRDIEERRKKEARRQKIEQRMEEIGSNTVDRLKEELAVTVKRQKDLEKKADALKILIHDSAEETDNLKKMIISQNEELLRRQRELSGFKIPAGMLTGQKPDCKDEASKSDEVWAADCIQEMEREFQQYIEEEKHPRFDRLLQKTEEKIQQAVDKGKEERDRLVDIRSAYLKKHPNREFSPSSEQNKEYDALLLELACDRIKSYEEKATQQARTAVEHFKEDFIYKIRSAIKEAYIRRDELNHIIRKLNFGKDKYQFKITRSKGSFGEYYDMFMDEALAIDPSTLSSSVERQMNMFSLEHEDRYGTLMNDLIHVFIPPENAGTKEQEEARKNMEKYADYRTYLSFEMEQIVEGEKEQLVIGLSRMIRKNSGGEGQNPLYVALLASFAQTYHINLSSKLARRPAIRLVVLDEAFSKMDAEKVASCIELIRGLGFQAIISATNDKIQNYLENVDKTFVYANPNKKSISIQEFEKKDFAQLSAEEGICPPLT